MAFIFCAPALPTSAGRSPTVGVRTARQKYSVSQRPRMCEQSGPGPDSADLASVDNAALYRDLRARRVALYGAELVAIQDKQFRSASPAPPTVFAGTVSAVVACWILALYFLLNTEGVR